METKFGTVDHPVYGTLDFPLAEGAKSITLAQADEWLKANPDYTSTLKIKNHAAATKDSLDELSKNLGSVDRAQLYLYNFFDKNGANIAKNFGKMGAEATLSTVGQGLGAATGPLAPIAIPALGSAGAFVGNVGAQFVNDGRVNWGDAGGAAITGAVPGGSLAKLTSAQLALLGAKQSLAAVAADTVRKKVDEKRTITAPEALSSAVFGYASPYLGKALDRASNAPTREAAERALHDGFNQESGAMGRELGLVRIPTDVNPESQMLQKLESMSGVIDNAKAAIRINQPRINKAVREELGLMPGNAFNPNTVDVYVAAAAKPYEDVGKLSSNAADALLEWRKNNTEARKAWQSYYSGSGGPQAQQIAKQADFDSEAALNVMKAEAQSAGRNDLIAELEAARVKLAKIGAAEFAMNKGSANIDPVVLGKMLDDGYPLSGNFLKIARFQNANSRVAKDASGVSAPGVNRLAQIITGASVIGGATAGSVAGKGDAMMTGAGTVAGALGGALASRAITAVTPQPGTIPRAIMFSDAFQNRLVKPNYGATIQDPAAAMARYMTARQGQEEPVQAQLSQYISR